MQEKRSALLWGLSLLLSLGAASANPATAQEPAPQETASGRTSAVQADAEAQPLWELGIGAGGGWLPDYPAADQNHLRGLALPYLRYRGEFLRSDEKGLLRGRFINTPDVEFDISLNGSFPTESDENDARTGMPDLDWLGEIGPRVEWTVARAAKDVARIWLDVPLRTVWSTNFRDRFDFRGIVFQPELAYQHKDFLDSGTSIKLGLAPTFGSEELMDMFYEVEPQYVTASRSQYDAEAGYLGSRLQMTASRSLTPWVRLHGLVSAQFHQGATNAGSPLFREETNFSAALGLTVTLAKSRRSASGR